MQAALKSVRYVRGGDVHRAVRQAIGGRPIVTVDQACCITLYHAFSRMAESATHAFLMRKLPGRDIQVHIVPRAAVAGAN